MFFILTCIILLQCLYWYFTRNFNYWQKRNVAYVKPFLFVGNLYPVIKEKQSIGTFLASLYGSTVKPYLGFFLLNKPGLLLRDPEVIKNILIKDFEHFTDRTAVQNESDRFGVHLMLLAAGKKWKQLRLSVTSLFSTSKNRSMLPLITEVCDRLIECINNTALDKKSIDCHPFCVRYAVDVICNCFFGLNSHSLDMENSIFPHMTRKFSEVKFLRNIQMASYFTAPLLVKTFKMKFLDPTAANFMHNIFFQTMTERKKSKVFRGDLIDILLKSYDDQQKNSLENDKLSAMFMQFLVAGYETSGNSLSFGIFELSRHQDIQSRLRNEIRHTLKKHGTLTYDAIQDMKYLDMVVKETSRKYPLLPFLDRRCVKTYKLPNDDLIIEKGNGVYISVFGLHYDPKYFPNPEKFDPERFRDKLNIPSCVYLPFGDGLRKCIGSRFAILSTKVVLVKLLLNFHIDKSEDATDSVPFAQNWIFLVPKKGLHVCFKPLKLTESY